ncbi:unnamed protein product, partial [Iphiclides podalirius]
MHTHAHALPSARPPTVANRLRGPTLPSTTPYDMYTQAAINARFLPCFSRRGPRDGYSSKIEPNASPSNRRQLEPFECRAVDGCWRVIAAVCVCVCVPPAADARACVRASDATANAR